MMKKIILFAVIFSIHCTCATEVKLQSNDTELAVNETIILHLEIKPSEPVGGNLAVYREISPKRYAIIRVLYNKPSPAECFTCSAGTPLNEELSRNFYFMPTTEGNYFVEANFGGIQKKVNFTVTVLTTTSTTATLEPTTTTSTLESTTTTSTSSTTSISGTTTSTTTLRETISTLSPKEDNNLINSILEFFHNLLKTIL